MSAKTLRLALIGCGNMGSYYAHNVSKLKDVEIVSCCDPSEEKLHGFMEKWEIPSGSTDWKTLIQEHSEQKVDGVINCTLDKLHDEIFQACAHASLPLLTEKPFAVSFKTLRKIPIQTLMNHILVINFSKRSIPAVAGALDFVRTGGLGKLQRFELHYRQGWVFTHDYGDWHNTSAWFWRLCNDFSQHGVLGDLGSHLFDLLVCFGGDAESLTCNAKSVDKGDSEIKGHRLDSWDEADCLIQMASGASALLSTSRISIGHKDKVELLIIGEKGSLKIYPEDSRNSFELYQSETGNWRTVSCSDRPEKSLDLFIQKIRSGGDLEKQGIQDAIKNHLMIEAAAAGADSGGTIHLQDFAEKQWGALWQEMQN